MFNDVVQSNRLRIDLARVCRGARIQLDLTQEQVARRVGVSRSFIAKVERGTANPSLAVAERLIDALGVTVVFDQAKLAMERSLRGDIAHSRCSGYVYRRLERAGWQVAREVAIVDGRWHGWIDLLAFHAATGTLLVIEIKSRIDDVGALERQVGWYVRNARRAARELGWRPRHVVAWVLALASAEVERSISANRETLRQAFPSRATAMSASLAEPGLIAITRGLALIDPASRARTWLLGSTSDGRRSRTPYLDYGDAVHRWHPTASPVP